MCISLRFELEPVSVNKAYCNGSRGRFLSGEAKAFKEAIIEATRAQIGAIHPELLDRLGQTQLRVEIEISSSRWINKDGSIKKRDISSYEKILIDSVFEGLNIDDSRIFLLSMSKRISKSEYISIQIGTV